MIELIYSWYYDALLNGVFRPITEEEFFDAVEEELDKRDQLELESAESNRLKQQPTTPNEHHKHTIGLDFKIRVTFCRFETVSLTFK